MLNMCCINLLLLKKTRPRVSLVQRKLIRRIILEDISNVESVGNVHVSWKFNLVGIITKLLENSKRANLPILKLTISADGKPIFTQMYHDQVTLMKNVLAPMLVCSCLVSGISLFGILSHFIMNLLNAHSKLLSIIADIGRRRKTNQI